MNVCVANQVAERGALQDVGDVGGDEEDKDFFSRVKERGGLDKAGFAGSQVMSATRDKEEHVVV